MEKLDLPVADRYHELDDEVITILNNLHNNAASYFLDLENFSIEPVRGMVRTDIAALNRTDGIHRLLEAEAMDISHLFKLDMRYRRQAGQSTNGITLGLTSRTDPDTNREHYDFYATKFYPTPEQSPPPVPEPSRLGKLGARALQMAGRARNLIETKAQPKLRGIQRKLGSLASRIAQPVQQR